MQYILFEFRKMACTLTEKDAQTVRIYHMWFCKLVCPRMRGNRQSICQYVRNKQKLCVFNVDECVRRNLAKNTYFRYVFAEII